MLTRRLLIVAITTLVTLSASHSAFAQEFTKIVDSYHCARFSNGNQLLVSKSESGFSLVNVGQVKDRFNRQRRLLVQRSKLISEAIVNFKKSRIAKSALIQTVNGALRKLFSDTPIPKTLPPDEAESQAIQLQARIQAEIATLDTVRGLLSECESGVNLRKGRGTLISPSVDPVVVITSQAIIGGFMFSTAPQKHEFSKKPGGFNACIKAVYPSGFVSKVYLGFDDDANCSVANFDGLSQTQCAALVPDGRVGYLVQATSYNLLSLTGTTPEQFMDRVRLELIPQTPVVSALGFLTSISRERAIQACNEF